MKNLKWASLIILALITFKMIGASNIDEVSLEDFQKLSKERKVVLIDVREKNEFESGHIQGATLIPLSMMNEKKAEFDKLIKEASKDKEVYVYCRSGRRSGIVKDELLKQNYKVKNLGGFENLIKKGFKASPES